MAALAAVDVVAAAAAAVAAAAGLHCSPETCNIHCCVLIYNLHISNFIQLGSIYYE